MRNSGKALLGLVLQHEGVKPSNRCPCLLQGGQAGSFNGVTGRGRLVGWAGGGVLR